MTDFTALVASKEWEPLVEAGAKAIHAFRQKWGFGGSAEFDWEPLSIRELHIATSRAAIAAFLSAAAEKGVAREAFGYDSSRGEDNWQTYTSTLHRNTCDFPALILKTGVG